MMDLICMNIRQHNLSLCPHVSSSKRHMTGNQKIGTAMLVPGFSSAHPLSYSGGRVGENPGNEYVVQRITWTPSLCCEKSLLLNFFKKLFWMKLQFLNFLFSFFFYLQDSTFAAFISERYVEHRVHREEKSLRHVAMVAKCLDDNKPIKSLKSPFALFQTSPILFNFI